MCDASSNVHMLLSLQNTASGISTESWISTQSWKASWAKSEMQDNVNFTVVRVSDGIKCSQWLKLELCLAKVLDNFRCRVCTRACHVYAVLFLGTDVKPMQVASTRKAR